MQLNFVQPYRDNTRFEGFALTEKNPPSRTEMQKRGGYLSIAWKGGQDR